MRAEIGARSGNTPALTKLLHYGKAQHELSNDIHLGSNEAFTVYLQAVKTGKPIHYQEIRVFSKR